MSDYVCAKCGYPAINSTVFRNEKYTETLTCPKCNSERIIEKINYSYRIGWKIIKESGADAKIKEIDGVFLKLGKKGDKITFEGTLQEKDLPRDVIDEFKKKTEQIQRIIEESKVLDKMKDLDIQIEHFISVIR